MRMVNVPLGNRSYKIMIEGGCWPGWARNARSCRWAGRCAIISDTNVFPRYAKVAERSLVRAGFESCFDYRPRRAKRRKV